MVTIRPATIEDIPLICRLTEAIWPATYSQIISPTQIQYMVEMMYSVASLQNQITTLQHRFVICYVGDEPVGFASFAFISEEVTKLHKIYVLPGQQGKGIGKTMVDYIMREARRAGTKFLELNVNRKNVAQNFYEKLGFKIVREEDIDIGSGYWMNDYVMRLDL